MEIIISLFKIIFFSCICVALGDNGTLRALQVIMRHGDREPDKSIYNLGQLTSEGKQQMFNLGRYIRNQYPTLVQDKFDSQEVTFISSDIERCINSGLLFGRGFYHKYNAESIWDINHDVKYEPISIKNIPLQFDKYITNNYPCPKYRLHETTNTQFFNTLVSRNEKILRRAALETGDNSVFDQSKAARHRGAGLVAVVESARSNISQNVPVQDWAMELLTNEDINRYLYDLLELDVSTPKKQLFVNGPFIQLVLENFENQLSKIAFYFGHDRNMFTLMRTLGVWDDQDYLLPPTGSALILELHETVVESEENFYMEFWYRNHTAHAPRQLQLPNCSYPCTLKKFRKNFKNVISVDYEAECKLDDDDKSFMIKN